MRKSTGLISAAALVAVAYTGFSWYVGQQAEQAIVEGVDQANARFTKMLGPNLSGTHFVIRINDYQRGVFSSTAEYVVSTTDSQGNSRDYIVQDHLQHGPFPLATLRTGNLAPLLAYSQATLKVTPAVKTWFDADQGETPLQIVSRIGFGNKGVSTWTLSPLEINRDDGDQLSFSGGEVRIEFKNGFNNNVAYGHFDSYRLKDGASGEQLDVRDIALQSTTQVSAPKQFDHQSQAVVKSLTVSGDALSAPVAVHDLTVALTSTQADDLVDSGLHYQFGRVDVDEVSIGQLSAALSASRVNVRALADLQLSYAAMEKKRDAGQDTDLTPDEQAQLKQKLAVLLDAGPVISIDSFVWQNAVGQSQASASLAWQKPEHEDAADIDLLKQLISNAKLDVSISRPMVVQLFQQFGANDDVSPEQAGLQGGEVFDEYAEGAARAGLMTLDDDTLSLSLDASPATNKVVLNGKTMSMDELLMLGLGVFLLQ